MPKKVEKTFRFAFVRRKIQTMFKSRALKAALLAELYGGKDAALVAQMVEKVSPIAKPPVQAVAPLPPVRRRKRLQQHLPTHLLQWKLHPQRGQQCKLPQQRLLSQPHQMEVQLQQQWRYLTLIVIGVTKRHLVNFVFCFL